MRDGLEVTDINDKKVRPWQSSNYNRVKDEIEGSSPSKLTKLVQAHGRLEVKDILKDGTFESKRSTNPLEPNYQWRDKDDKGVVNNSYGKI